MIALLNNKIYKTFQSAYLLGCSDWKIHKIFVINDCAVCVRGLPVNVRKVFSYLYRVESVWKG